jgi:hypothetical protein
MRFLSIFLSIVLVLAPIAPFTTAVNADWPLLRRGNRVCFDGSCQQQVVQQRVVVPHVQQQVVQQQVVQPQFVAPQQQVQAKTTVVNNVIGIPVPVQYTAPISSQGSTVYGYSSVSQSYGQVDMGLLYNQAARLTDQAQQLAGQASLDFSSLVQAEGQNRAEVAKILAQGQAAREALMATRPQYQQQEQQQLRSFSFRVVQGQNGEMKIEKIDESPQDARAPAAEQPVNIRASTILENSCVQCHNSNNAAGGLNMTLSMDDDDYAKILKRVNTDDLGLRMPRNPDGTAGQKLSPQEIQTLTEALSR